jgi:hypothetical protein
MLCSNILNIRTCHITNILSISNLLIRNLSSSYLRTYKLNWLLNSSIYLLYLLLNNRLLNIYLRLSKNRLSNINLRLLYFLYRLVYNLFFYSLIFYPFLNSFLWNILNISILINLRNVFSLVLYSIIIGNFFFSRNIFYSFHSFIFNHYFFIRNIFNSRFSFNYFSLKSRLVRNSISCLHILNRLGYYLGLN